jgi:hypothetical protein
VPPSVKKLSASWRNVSSKAFGIKALSVDSSICLSLTCIKPLSYAAFNGMNGFEDTETDEIILLVRGAAGQAHKRLPVFGSTQF